MLSKKQLSIKYKPEIMPGVLKFENRIFKVAKV